MGKLNLLYKLYNSHYIDLNSVKPELQDVFICPICLDKFTQADIGTKQLSDGHIWPMNLREKNRNIIDHRVLICTKCNNTAGGHGDAQIGIFEQVREGEKDGILYGVRLVEIITDPAEKPIKLKATVTKDNNSKSLSITGKLNKNLNFLGSSPEDRHRFIELADSGQKNTIIVQPPSELKSQLLAPAWFTSAYLFAFYRLGYRYILHPYLDKVRKYILASFEKNTTTSLEIPNDDDFRILEWVV